jgi:phosphoribosyl 1,2-cyclic phosphodiesterase
MTPGTKFNIDDITIEAIRALHGDADAVSIKIYTPDTGTIAYTSDTEAYPGLGEALAGARLLIMGTMWPRGNHLVGHLCTEDALKLIKEAKPRCAATTHYGIKLLNADPAKEAAWLQDQTGVPTFATEDGMVVTLAENIIVKGPRKADAPRTIPA